MSHNTSLMRAEGPGGYVAAIKAAQLGLKVRHPVVFCISSKLMGHPDSLHREARCIRWNMSKRWMHSLESHAEQLTPLPPNST